MSPWSRIGEADEWLTQSAFRHYSGLLGDIGLWSWDFQRDCGWFCDRSLAIFGTSVAPRNREDLLSFCYADDSKALSEALGRTCETGNAFSVEVRVKRTSDGAVRLLHLYGTVCPEDGPVPGSLFAAAIDTTEPRRTRRTFEAKTARLEEALFAGNIGLWEWTLLDNHVYYSDQWKRQLGYEPEEIGSALDEWAARVHPDEIEPVSDSIRNFLDSSETEHEAQYRLLHKRGYYIWVLARFSAQRNATGKPDKMFGFHEDVTARKEADITLRERAHELQSVLNAGQALIWVSGPDLKCTYFNGTWLSFTGRTLELELGDGWCDGVHPDDLERTMSTYHGSCSRHEPFYIEFRLRTANGTYRWINDDGRPRFDSRGKFVGYIGYCRDLTHERELEQQLRQAQKLESVGRLAGGIAHDFNNMLGVILGHAEMMKHRLPEADPLQDDLTQIIAAGKRSAEVTQQLLGFARKQPMVPRLIDLNEALESTLTLLQRLLSARITLSWERDPDVWPVRIDPVQLDQVLTNIVVNARDAIDTQGAITVSLKNKTLNSRDSMYLPESSPGDYVMLSVSDNGSGMNAETLGKIFEPFFTTKEVGKGTGLGLSTVHGIVHQNGGFLVVTSEPGRGTTMDVYLPRAIGTVTKKRTAPDSRDAPRGTETVLLVEDEESVLRLTKRLLEGLGYRVLAAASPLAALEIAAQADEEIELVIADMVMPEMTGREVCEAVLQLRPQIACLFVSGYPAGAERGENLSNGHAHFLAKPYTRQELAIKVREALGH